MEWHWQEKTEHRHTCPSATLSITNLIRTNLEKKAKKNVFHLAENILHHYNARSGNVVHSTYKNHTKHVHTVCKQNAVFNVYLLVHQTVVLFAGTFHIITITKHLHVWRFRCPNCPSTCFGKQLAAFRNKMIQDQHKTGVHDDAIAHEAEALRYKLEGRGFDFQWSQRECFIALILPAALWSWDRLCL